jgi:hypothetical protein
MDGIVMVDGRTGKLWMWNRGEHSHALGLRVKVEEDGLFVEQLLLFRQAVTVENVECEAEPVAFIEGTGYHVRCSLCNSRRTWWTSRNAIKRALRTYKAE